MTPLSGTYAGLGQQVKWGLDLAAKEINDAGGVMGRKIDLIYEDEEANPAVATQKAEKLFQVNKVDFLTGTVNSGSTLAVGQVAERNQRLIATTVSFADSITADKCSPNVFRVNARAGMQSAALAEWLSKEKPNANVFYLAPTTRWGAARWRRSSRRPRARARARWARSSRRWITRTTRRTSPDPLGAPTSMYTSVAGNDTVRLFSQLAEFGLGRNLQIVGASGTLTSQNLPAIGKAAEGFVTGVGYSPLIDSAENKKFVAAFQAMHKALPDLYGADSYGVLFFYKAAVEKAKSTETDKVRAAMRDLEWATPQGVKKMRAGDHQAMQDMYAVRVTNGEFRIVGKVPAAAAVGPDACSKW